MSHFMINNLFNDKKFQPPYALKQGNYIYIYTNRMKFNLKTKKKLLIFFSQSSQTKRIIL
jgi:hypothetical protein